MTVHALSPSLTMAWPDNMGGVRMTGPSPNRIRENTIAWLSVIALLSQGVATALHDQQLLKDIEAFEMTKLTACAVQSGMVLVVTPVQSSQRSPSQGSS
jgi:hypothetical protein